MNSYAHVVIPKKSGVLESVPYSEMRAATVTPTSLFCRMHAAKKGGEKITSQKKKTLGPRYILQTYQAI
jgi:hypothetical protein